MKNFYAFQVTDLRFQIDHFTHRKIQLFDEISEDPNNDKLFGILATHRQIEFSSDGKKL